MIGAHVPSGKVLSTAKALDIGVVQFNIGNPRKWEHTEIHTKSEEIAASVITSYIHAPYLINIASPKPPQKASVGSLKRQGLLASHVGAEAVVVHGGSATDGDKSEGRRRWSQFFNEYDGPTKILIENAASGKNSMTATLEDINALWAHLRGNPLVGFCLDTAHVWSSGIDLDRYVDEVKEIVGTIDLVHANGSKDRFGGHTDRHATWEESTYHVKYVAQAVVKSECRDAILESPNAVLDLPVFRQEMANYL